MGDDDLRRGPRRPLDGLNSRVQQGGAAAAASYGLIGAILLGAAIGYGIDLWADASPWGLLIGLMVGLVVGFYQLALMVWRR